MRKKVGIPKSLLYYNYHPVFDTFFRELGADIVLSEPDKLILEKGRRMVTDDICLPVKNFFGHIVDLKEKNVDFLFLPRFVRLEKDASFCPKIIGIPDLVKNIVPDLPPVLTPDINIKKGRLFFYNNIYRLGKVFNANIKTIYDAWMSSLKNYRIYKQGLKNNLLTFHVSRITIHDSRITLDGSRLNIALVGHSYNIYDSSLNLNLLAKLKEKGINYYTPDMVTGEDIKRELFFLPKKIFWTLSKEVVGSAKYFIKQPNIHGLINIVSFACGPDSLMGEMVNYLMKGHSEKPVLTLVLDEHTGEAGLETRLEAFLEMVKMRQK